MKELIKKLLRENLNNQHLNQTNVDDIVYHQSNPHFRNDISKQGLIPKGKSETWLSDTKINGNVIFVSNSQNKNNWFKSGYDDDIYSIDTTKLPNKWYLDPNFNNNDYVITYQPIPLNAIKLIYKGTGESLD